MRIGRNLSLVCLVLIVSLAACHSYRSQVVPLKAPSSYPNAIAVAEATVGAQAYEDKKDAKAAFGFDIRAAGLAPVQVVFDNKGDHGFEIVADQTFLVDEKGNLWPILEMNTAYERIAKSTELGKAGSDAVKYGTLTGVAGAIVGGAIGIVTGLGVGDMAAKGAAAGAASGAVIGGARGLSSSQVKYRIREDLRGRALENRAIKPHEMAHGFLFFPGESGRAQELRLGVREVDTSAFHALVLKLE